MFTTINRSGSRQQFGLLPVHRPTPETDRNLSVDELYLCDSGAQYM